jgi:phosphoglycerate-specific signal transduction histidine kinase
MNSQRYAAYRSLVTELQEWRAAHALEEQAHEDLRDAAEGLLLAREGDEAEEPLARASTTVLGMLALDELDEQNASWLLDALLSCGPRLPQAIGDAA